MLLAAPVEVCPAGEIKPLLARERKKFLYIHKAHLKDLSEIARAVAEILDKNLYLTRLLAQMLLGQITVKDAISFSLLAASCSFFWRAPVN